MNEETKKKYPVVTIVVFLITTGMLGGLYGALNEKLAFVIVGIALIVGGAGLMEMRGFE